MSQTTRKLASVLLILTGAVLVGAGLIPRPDVIAPVAFDQLGLAPNHSEAAAVVAARTPRFMLVGAAAEEDNSKKNVRLWDSMLLLRGQHFPNVPQEIGDCVSWGAANAVNYLQSVQLTRGPPDAFEFAPAYPPYIYGTSRVTVGRKHGSHFRGDGSVGAYAAEALRDCGCLKATAKNCPPYSGAVAKEWGARGPPDWALDEAKRYTVETIAQVNTADEVRDAVCHGFPVTIASSWGTKTIRPRDGRNVANHDASWPHQMCVIAYDGSGPNPYWYVLNSWGPKAHPAPLQNEPPGGFWIDRKSMNYIASQGDCWALSGFEGFPAEELDWDQLLHRTRATVGAVQPPQVQEPIAMFVDPLFVGAFCLGLFGVLLWPRGKSLGRTIALALIAGLSLLPSLACADEPPLDFSVARTRTGTATATIQTTTPPVVETPLDWSAVRPPAVEPPTAACADEPPLDFSVARTRTGTATATIQTTTPPVVETPLDWSAVRPPAVEPPTAHAAAKREPLPTLDWTPCDDPADAATVATTKPHPTALIFIRGRNCSDCDKIKAHVRTYVQPNGWIVKESSTIDHTADFVLIDVLKDTRLKNQYAIQAVPTTIYLDKQGRETSRFDGFTPPRGLTQELNRLR